jgi:hypothetical protein
MSWIMNDEVSVICQFVFIRILERIKGRKLYQLRVFLPGYTTCKAFIGSE